MAKHRKRRASARRSNRHRRHNPFGFGGGHHKRHHRRRRHNPMGFNVRSIGTQLLWGTAGGVAALTVPGLVASSYNSGWTGYLLNGATAWAGSLLVGKMAGPQAGQDFFVGGLVATGLRIFNNFFGSTLPVGLSGMGFYLQNNFPLPTTGQGPFLLNDGYGGGPMASVPISAQGGVAIPAGAALQSVPPQGVQSSDEPSRWAKWAA
jgi:hypothetical protein